MGATLVFLLALMMTTPMTKPLLLLFANIVRRRIIRADDCTNVCIEGIVFVRKPAPIMEVNTVKRSHIGPIMIGPGALLCCLLTIKQSNAATARVPKYMAYRAKRVLVGRRALELKKDHKPRLVLEIRKLHSWFQQGSRGHSICRLAAHKLIIWIEYEFVVVYMFGTRVDQRVRYYL